MTVPVSIIGVSGRLEPLNAYGRQRYGATGGMPPATGFEPDWAAAYACAGSCSLWLTLAPLLMTVTGLRIQAS